MNKPQKDVKLYNVLFPLWVLLLFPHAWLIVLPGNFAIDSAVLLITLLILKCNEKKRWYKKYILLVFAFGLLADIVGAAFLMYMFYMMSFEVLPIKVPMDSPLITIPAMLISAGLIFVFNYFITFRKEDKKMRLIMSLVLAIVTAPYTFLIPTSWLYGFGA